MFTGVERGASPPAVQAIWQWVADRVEVGVGDQRLVVIVHPADAVFGGVRLPAADISGCHGCHHDVGVALGGFDERQRRMRAAPKMLMLSGLRAVDSAIAVTACSTGKRRCMLGTYSDADEISRHHRQPRRPLHQAQQRRRRCRVVAAQQRPEQHPV